MGGGALVTVAVVMICDAVLLPPPLATEEEGVSLSLSLVCLGERRGKCM